MWWSWRDLRKPSMAYALRAGDKAAVPKRSWRFGEPVTRALHPRQHK
ncbi:MAG: hypothetical protein LAT77_01335 [Aliidiomarina sp.]|nr:hypothetical protein [Aliidiomarina sp.]MCH8500537.1 hypothetical protein [Aliidiomarina sp.]